MTNIRDAHGVEAAQAIAGHAKADTTAIYTKTTDALAAAVAGKCG